MIEAAIFLNHGNPGAAIHALTPLEPYELTGDDTTSPAYERGQAFLAARQGAAAALEFQTILDHPGVMRNFVVGAVARLGLARAYALTGDTAKARAAYQQFFEVWKNADPGLPALLQAKAEFAKLQ
jgi:hypothetical protein